MSDAPANPPVDPSTLLAPADEPDAYSLLSKPTLELSDAEVSIIIQHLRAKRLAYVQSNGKKADKRPTAKAPAEPITEEKKADNTSLMLALLAGQKGNDSNVD